MANSQSTAKLTPNLRSHVTNNYFDLNEPFAVPRYGNICIPYMAGVDYMKAVADAIRNATNFILIADWQLDYDVELDQRGVAGHPGRLSELLAAAMQRGVHVRVMLYDSVDSLSALGSPDTHEEQAQKILEALPKGKGTVKVMLQNPNTGKSSLPTEKNSNIRFSHHQKFVVVDSKIAFLGGIDLAYGRWDTTTHPVVIDPKVHVLNDAYNAQITPARSMTAAEKTLTGYSNGKPGFRAAINQVVLDERTQPRQPWNDVAVKIEGSAAFDAYVNFVLRWNSFAVKWTNSFDDALYPHWMSTVFKPVLVNPLAGDGKCTVQIARSASSAQLKDELEVWKFQQANLINDDHAQNDAARRNIMLAARKAWSSHHQTSIYDAMVACIRAAQSCIYIENQFFISNCGKDIHGTSSPAKNEIIAELANAIGQAIYNETAFHVWIVLPEHPEGMLEDEGTSSQAWWALQGIKHGNNSLINRINATILKKYSKQWGIDKPIHANQDIQDMLKIRGMQDKWREYLTVLNLRNYGNTGQAVVTEMIYTHSKLMIVDDAVAVIGSANINDRSLLGNGDTELAAVIMDTQDAKMTAMGQGVSCVTRKFARELRISRWKKHLGMLIDEATTGVQKESSPPLGIHLERPLDKASIQGLQALAANNRKVYNLVFRHTPRNEFTTLLQGRKQYPPQTQKVKKYEINGTPIGNVNPDGTLREGYVLVDEAIKGTHDFSKLPSLQTNYMTRGEYPRHNFEVAMNELKANIKGFIVEMPLDWGVKEKVTPPAPDNDSSLIAKIETVGAVKS